MTLGTTISGEAIETKIDACWERGSSIAETREAVERVYGVDPGFEPVRRRFVELAELVTV